MSKKTSRMATRSGKESSEMSSDLEMERYIALKYFYNNEYFQQLRFEFALK
jgi:hypothetical protein